MQKHYLADIIEPIVEALGFDVVRILTIGDSNQTLQVMIEHLDTKKEITVDDCALVSRAISAELDEKDPIENQYTLEVSSPGLDRPLTKLEHFSRYIGYDVKIETSDLIEKRKRFKGKIKEVTPDNNIIIDMEGTLYTIAYTDIAKAKLILTDELWAEYTKTHKTVQS